MTEGPQTNGVPGGAQQARRDAPIGGQAVLEGVMMRGVSTWAVAVRKPTPQQLKDADGHLDPTTPALGEIEVVSEPLVSWIKRHRLLRLPLVRGVVALAESLKIGFKALGISANAQVEEEDEEIGGGTWIGTVIFSVVLAVGLFFILPVAIASLMKGFLPGSLVFVLVEKVIRISIFLGYLWLISRMRELQLVIANPESTAAQPPPTQWQKFWPLIIFGLAGVAVATPTVFVRIPAYMRPHRKITKRPLGIQALSALFMAVGVAMTLGAARMLLPSLSILTLTSITIEGHPWWTLALGIFSLSTGVGSWNGREWAREFGILANIIVIIASVFLALFSGPLALLFLGSIVLALYLISYMSKPRIKDFFGYPQNDSGTTEDPNTGSENST